MEKEEIKSRYENMVKTIETAKMYDGRGTYDLYVCEKFGYQKITTYKDKGVTSFMLKCKNCDGWMQHTNTYQSVPDDTPVEQFVRPSLDVAYKLTDYQLDHLFKGGLFLESDLPKIDDDTNVFDHNKLLGPHRYVKLLCEHNEEDEE